MHIKLPNNILINRNLYSFLEEWKNSNSRMPLILRGARQVGKTTLVNYFGESFDQYLYFNLEKNADKELFENVGNLEITIQLLFLSRNKISDKKRPHLSLLTKYRKTQKYFQH